MQIAVDGSAAPSRSANLSLWSGHAVTGLAVLFLATDAGCKLIVPELMIANSPPLGLPDDPGFMRLLGIILAVSAALYAWRRTSFLGALLLTAYLGGAVAIHLRVGSPLFSHTLFGTYLGLLVWGGLWLRDARVRALFSFR
jgi:hypothetical protein